MIRPSLQNLAKNCGYVPKLALDYPETGPAPWDGTSRHKELNAWVDNGTLPADPGVLVLSRYIEKRFPKDAYEWLSEYPIVIADPDTGEIITAGTLDFAAIPKKGGMAYVLDMKGSPFGNTPPADENLQVQAYCQGLAIDRGLCHVTPILAYVLDVSSEDDLTIDEGKPLDEDGLTEVYRQLEANHRRERLPAPGVHCERCYYHQHCYAWQSRATTAIHALAAVRNGNGKALESDNDVGWVLESAGALEELAEWAKLTAKTLILSQGKIATNSQGKVYGVTQAKGKASIDVEALAKDGLLEKYQREGKPFERWTWRKPKAA